MPASIRLNISEPCHEDWQQMTLHDNGRHCGSCQKIVTDFSSMTDKEILSYINNAAYGICGRLAGDQLNKAMPAGEKKKMPIWVYGWNLAIAGFLFIMNANGQSKVGSKGKIVEQRLRPQSPPEIVMGKLSMVKVQRRAISGFVYDKETRLPIQGATVQMKGTMAATSADSLGTFTIEGAGVLTISAIGYKKSEYVAEDDGTIPFIYLEQEARELQEVVVVAYPTTTCRISTGGISMVRTETRYTKVRREINEWLPKNDVKLYPNPAVLGSNVNIKLALKEPGKYSMEVFSTDGMRVYSQPVVLQTKEYLASLPVNPLWARGVYWVRISGGHTRRVYHAKLMVQ